jgi:hypothetical protein
MFPPGNSFCSEKHLCFGFICLSLLDHLNETFSSFSVPTPPVFHLAPCMPQPTACHYHHHHHMTLQSKSGPGLPFWGFVTIPLLRGWIVSPAPNPQPGGPGLRTYDPRPQGGPAMPPGTGYSFQSPFTTCMGYSGTILLSRPPHGISVLLVPSLIPPPISCLLLTSPTYHSYFWSTFLPLSPHTGSPTQTLNGSSMSARTIPHNSFTRVGQFPLSDSL